MCIRDSSTACSLPAGGVLIRRPEEIAQTLHALDGLLQQFLAEVHGIPIVATHKVGNQRFRPIMFQGSTQEEDIADTLGHLLIADIEHAVMHPEANKWTSQGTFCLGHFVLVMREYQISPPTMYVKSFPQVLQAHGGTLYMPSRSSRTPWTGPGRLPWFRPFPQHKIKRVFLYFLRGNAGPAAHLPHLLLGKTSILRKGIYIKVDIASGRIGPIVFNQSVRYFPGSTPFLLGHLNDAVIYVRNILYQDDFVAQVFKVALGYHGDYVGTVSYTHLRAHETKANLVCRLLLEK